MVENNLNARADQLGRAVADLGDAVHELTERTAVSAAQLRRARRLTRITAAGLVLDVLLTLVMLYVLNRQRMLDDADEVLSTDVLCPLYGVFIASFDPARRNGLAPEQRIKYDHAVVVVRRGATLLGCPQQ